LLTPIILATEETDKKKNQNPKQETDRRMDV
jgi:hypothetical protein